MDRSDFEPIGAPSANDHDMGSYCVSMHPRLSRDARVNAANPDSLVVGDVPANGLFG